MGKRKVLESKETKQKLTSFHSHLVFHSKYRGGGGGRREALSPALVGRE